MKTKISTLKTHLSHYLPQNRSDLKLQQRLLDCGLIWDAKPVSPASSFTPNPQTPGDGLTDINTIQTIRNEKNW